MKKKLEHSECNMRLTAMEDTLYVIGGKWKLRIIIGLFEGPKRFNELQRTIKGISSKVLSSELKTLEENGFVERKVYPEQIPVMIEYRLTEYSKTLNKVLDAMVEWGTEHREWVKRMSQTE